MSRSEVCVRVAAGTAGAVACSFGLLGLAGVAILASANQEESSSRPGDVADRALEVLAWAVADGLLILAGTALVHRAVEGHRPRLERLGAVAFGLPAALSALVLIF